MSQLKFQSHDATIRVTIPELPRGATVKVVGPPNENRLVPVLYLAVERYWDMVIPEWWLSTYEGEYPHGEW